MVRIHKSNPQLWSKLILVVIIGCIGTIALAVSHGATPRATIEPELKTLKGNIGKRSDSSASYSGAIKFGGYPVSAGGNNALGGKGKLPALGFTTFMTMPAADRANTFQQLANTGAKWIRIGVNNPGDTAQNLDDRFKAAKAAGLNVLFQAAPYDYIDAKNAGNPNPPIDYDHFADIIVAAMKLYDHQGPDGGNPAFEVWNEANGNDPALYTKLTCTAYAKMKKYDPSVMLIAGSENVYAPPNQYGAKWEDWMTHIYDDGIGDCIDAFDFHDYDDIIAPTATKTTKLSRMQAIMADHGDANKPIWLTEIGLSACPAPYCSVGISDQYQADHLAADMVGLKTYYPQVQVAMVFTDRDRPELMGTPGDPGVNNTEAYYGIWHADSQHRTTTPKPAVAALKQLYNP